MIVPLVSEDHWMDAFRDLPSWDPPPLSVVLVSPHPDDETLGAGGLLAALRLRSQNVSIVAVTDGECAYGYDPDLGLIRQSEQCRAVARLGISPDNIVRLRLPDSAVSLHEDYLVDRLSHMVEKNTLIVAPWRGDFHPDHEACGRAAERVAHRTGAILISYFFWTFHRGTTVSIEDLKLISFPLDQQLVQCKLEALQCHRSQLQHDSGEPILPDNLLWSVRRPFEVFCIS